MRHLISLDPLCVCVWCVHVFYVCVHMCLCACVLIQKDQRISHYLLSLSLVSLEKGSLPEPGLTTLQPRRLVRKIQWFSCFHTHVHTHIHTHRDMLKPHTDMHTHGQVHTHMHVCNIQVCTHRGTHMHALAYTHLGTHAYMQVHTVGCTHVGIHT